MVIHWRPVRSARTLAEATLIAESLEGAGVLVTLRGQMRPSVAGEIPLPDACVEVCVPENEMLRAEATLARVEARAAEPDRTCPTCGEVLPATFEWCWKCGEA